MPSNLEKLVLAGVLAASTMSMATVKFPYPQAHAYDNASNITDVWNCSGQTASSMLKSQFDIYMKSYYEAQGDQARIKFDEAKYTVSEGIGYGMILMVYFSDNQKSYQSEFDKLWNYYKSHLDGNGLMNWKIDGFSGGGPGTGGATDAEEDVAFALAMAYYQFGDNKYKEGASSLIAKIRQYEFASDGMHYPGDQRQGGPKNPSYISPAAYEVFKDFDSGNSSFWDKAISTNYNLLLKNRNSKTGIPSGWSDASGNAQVGNNGYNFTGYDYDAVRAPWRWAWSYAWYGHSQAKDLSSKLAAWVSEQPAGQLYINMKQDGTANLTGEPCKSNGCKANGSSIGSLSASLIVDPKYKEKLDANYLTLISQQQGYYHSSLRLLVGLLVTGNFQNLKTATPTTVPEFVVPDSCNVPHEPYKSEGLFGWNSETCHLSNETLTGVHMGIMEDGYRDVSRTFSNLNEEANYTLSFVGTQTEGRNIYISYEVLDGNDGNGRQLCGKEIKMEALVPTTYTCNFSAKSSEATFRVTLDINDEPQLDISDLSLKDSSGNELIIPSSSSEIASSSSEEPAYSSETESSSSEESEPKVTTSSSAKSSSSKAKSSSSTKSSSSKAKSSASTSSSKSKKSSSSKKDAIIANKILSQSHITAAGRNVLMASDFSGQSYAIFDLQGHVINRGHIDGTRSSVTLPRAGAYIVRVGPQIQHINVK